MSKPADAESTPKEEADDRNNATENNQHSANIAHLRKIAYHCFLQGALV